MKAAPRLASLTCGDEGVAGLQARRDTERGRLQVGQLRDQLEGGRRPGHVVGAVVVADRAAGIDLEGQEARLTGHREAGRQGLGEGQGAGDARQAVLGDRRHVDRADVVPLPEGRVRLGRQVDGHLGGGGVGAAGRARELVQGLGDRAGAEVLHVERDGDRAAEGADRPGVGINNLQVGQREAEAGVGHQRSFFEGFRRDRPCSSRRLAARAPAREPLSHRFHLSPPCGRGRCGPRPSRIEYVESDGDRPGYRGSSGTARGPTEVSAVILLVRPRARPIFARNAGVEAAGVEWY